MTNAFSAATPSLPNNLRQKKVLYLPHRIQHYTPLKKLKRSIDLLKRVQKSRKGVSTLFSRVFQISSRSRALSTARVRSRTLSLFKIEETWLRMVPGDLNRAAAIS